MKIHVTRMGKQGMSKKFSPKASNKEMAYEMELQM
jgi:hypothetical protein